MARKNQVYSQETPLRTGLSDSRMMASITPTVTPKIIEKIVTRIVPFQKPSITGFWFMACNTNDQWNAGLKINRLRNINASTAIAAMATHRHGWRTGFAWIGPGRSSPTAGGSVIVAVMG